MVLSSPTQRRLTLLAVAGFAWWFFGNLYEAIVFSPNWVVDSASQMRRLNELFVNTSPTLYFVPVTPAAAVLAWVLLALNAERDVSSDYRRAAAFAALSMALNAFIVSTVISRLFGSDYASHADELSSYCWRWNVLNVARMALVAMTTRSLFAAFRKLDRKSAALGA